MAPTHALDTKPDARFFSAAQRAYLLDSFGYMCAACGCDDSSPKVLQIDHWQSFNGTNTVIDNGVVLCAACNGTKHDFRINAANLKPRKAIDSDSHRAYRIRESENRAAFADWIKTYGVKSKTLVPRKAPKFVAPW